MNAQSTLARGAASGPELRAAKLPAGFFRVAFEEARDAMVALGDDRRILDANAAACALFEQSRDRLGGRKMNELVLGESEGEGEIARADGSRCFVSMVTRPSVLPGVHLTILRDETERRWLEAHLLRADRLSTLGMLAAGVAHEINNPLTYAMTNLRLLARRVPDLAAEVHGAAEQARTDGSERADVLEAIAAALEQRTRMVLTASEGMDRVNTIVRDLRVSSRDGGGADERVDLRAVLESSINIGQGEIRHRARVVRNYGDTPVVYGSTSRLGQVFLNLLVNAAHAIPKERDEPGEIVVRIGTHDDGRAVVEIRDDGAGIEPALLPRVFDPFVTTKAPGVGTGLGLYIARSIVRDAGGDIVAESVLGAGTTLRVLLPPRTAP